MTDRELGQATIVYEDPEEDTVEKTVQNEYIAYFQDHWIIKADEDAGDKDRVRRIPHERVYYVERSVDEFEEEITSLRRQVQSFADDLRSRLVGGSQGGGGRSGSHGGRGGGQAEPRQIDVEGGDQQENEPQNQ